MTNEQLDEFEEVLSEVRMHGSDNEYVKELDALLTPLVKALREARAEVTQMSIRLRNAEQEIHAERQCALSAEAEHIRERDRLYTERNRLVALAAKMAERDGFDAGVREHKGDVEPGWSTVVVIDLPAGQVSWHLPDAEADAFTAALPEYLGSWDGHTTDEKHARIEAFLKEEP